MKFPKITEDRKQTNWFNEQIESTLKQLDVNSLEAILLHYPKDIMKIKIMN